MCTVYTIPKKSQTQLPKKKLCTVNKGDEILNKNKKKILIVFIAYEFSNHEFSKLLNL